MDNVLLYVVGSEQSDSGRFLRAARKFLAVPHRGLASDKGGEYHDDLPRCFAVLVDRADAEQLTEEEDGEMVELGAEGRASTDLFLGVVRRTVNSDTVSKEAEEEVLPQGVFELPNEDEERLVALLIWSCTTQFVGATRVEDASLTDEAPWKRKVRTIYSTLREALAQLPDPGGLELGRNALREALRSPVISEDETIVLSSLRSALDKYAQKGGPFHLHPTCRSFLVNGAELLMGADTVDPVALRDWVVTDVERLGLDPWLDGRGRTRRYGT